MSMHMISIYSYEYTCKWFIAPKNKPILLLLSLKFPNIFFSIMANCTVTQLLYMIHIPYDANIIPEMLLNAVGKPHKISHFNLLSASCSCEARMSGAHTFGTSISLFQPYHL